MYIPEITKCNIKKIQKHRYIDDNIELNNELFIKTITLLRDAHIKAYDKETLLLLRLEDYMYEECSNYNVSNVGFSDIMLNDMYKYVYTYIALHNHPYGGTFSVGDINQLLLHSMLVGIIAIDNSCKHSYFVIKTNKFKSSILVKVVSRVIKMLLTTKIININNDSSYILKLFEKSGAIIYKQYTNY